MSTVIPDSTTDDDLSCTSIECSLQSQEISPTETSCHNIHDAHHHHNESSSMMKRDREREGRCSDCGVQTHEFQFDPIMRERTKVPLTLPGEVHRGRCLFCHPIVPNQFLSQITTTTAPLPPQQQERRQSLNLYIGCFGAADNNTLEPNMHNLPRSIDWCKIEALRNIAAESAEVVDILSAMRRGSHDEVVQVRGCEKLWVQSWDDETAAAIGRVGGIPIVLEAMVRFPHNAHLQQCACETLQNLATDDYNSSVICELGGVRVIVEVMARHYSIAGIQQCCCNALANIASSSSPSHHHVIIQSGGGIAVIAAAQRFADEDSVLEGAYEALRALGYNPQQQQQS